MPHDKPSAPAPLARNRAAHERTVTTGRIVASTAEQQQLVQYNPNRVAISVYKDSAAGFISIGFDNAIVAGGITLTAEYPAYKATSTADYDQPERELFVKGQSASCVLYVLETVLAPAE